MQTFKQYSEAVKDAAEGRFYPLRGCNMQFPALKLAGEAGELADKIGKHIRNTTNGLLEGGCLKESTAYLVSQSVESLTEDRRLAMLHELGDVLWYVEALAFELGSTLEEVAVMNVLKCQDRSERGVVFSEGDDR